MFLVLTFLQEYILRVGRDCDSEYRVNTQWRYMHLKATPEIPKTATDVHETSGMIYRPGLKPITREQLYTIICIPPLINQFKVLTKWNSEKNEIGEK